MAPEGKTFPIGTPGQPWGDAEREEWRRTRVVQRSYQEEVISKLEKLDSSVYEVIKYGALEHDPERYPLFAVKMKNWKEGKPNVLVTGGVHGYEKSGVQGAILFLTTVATKYAEKFNIVVLPCVSPWGYETVQRWNYQAVDPNRSFNPDGQVVPGRSFNPEASTDESRNVIAFLKTLGVDKWTVHVDQVSRLCFVLRLFLALCVCADGLVFHATCSTRRRIRMRQSSAQQKPRVLVRSLFQELSQTGSTLLGTQQTFSPSGMLR